MVCHHADNRKKRAFFHPANKTVRPERTYDDTLCDTKCELVGGVSGLYAIALGTLLVAAPAEVHNLDDLMQQMVFEFKAVNPGLVVVACMLTNNCFMLGRSMARLWFLKTVVAWLVRPEALDVSEPSQTGDA